MNFWKKLFVKESPWVEKLDMYGRTALHLAAYHDKTGGAEAELLLAQGAEVNAKDNFGETPLHRATNEGRKDLAELLLAHGAKVNARDDRGEMPLHEAGNHKDVAELLLAHGAKVNAKDKCGRTPLHDAAYHGNKGVAELLLAHGAEVNAKDKCGRTPLHDAAYKERYQGKKDVAELLLAHGAEVNAKDKGGWTPLHAAVYRVINYGLLDVVELLLANGADDHAKDDEGLTPLEGGRREIDWGVHSPDQRARAANYYEALCQLLDRRQHIRVMGPVLERGLPGAVPTLGGPSAQSGEPCPVCGASMRKERSSLTLSCSEGHDRVSYYTFDNTYGTLSAMVASSLAKKGYRVAKSGEGDHYNIMRPA